MKITNNDIGKWVVGPTCAPDFLAEGHYYVFQITEELLAEARRLGRIIKKSGSDLMVSVYVRDYAAEYCGASILPQSLVEEIDDRQGVEVVDEDPRGSLMSAEDDWLLSLRTELEQLHVRVYDGSTPTWWFSAHPRHCESSEVVETAQFELED